MFKCPELACNNTFICRIKDVKAGKTRRCPECKAKDTSKRFRKDLTNKRFGHLTVISPSDKRNSSNKTLWRVQCDCGRICEKSTSDLTSHRVSTCGEKIVNIIMTF